MSSSLLKQIRKIKLYKNSLQLNSDSFLFYISRKSDMEDSYENALKE